ncbi:ankyrin repeat-containing domain protein [Mycena capillaripes]|nr:ankyrin repeat-containing domain protein [Mycena capillaripes]
MAELVGFVSAVAGLVTLAGQISKISYGYLSDVRDAQRMRGRYLTELSAFTDALKHAEKAAVDAEQLDAMVPRPAHLSAKVLDECHTHLLALHRSLETPKTGGSLSRLKATAVWPLEEAQMKKHIEMLHRFRSIFSDYVSSSTLALSEAAYRKLDVLTREQARSKLLEWLQPVTLLRHGPPAEPPCPGTCTWFLESDIYLGWRTSAPSLVWCRGKPGVGKSVLSTIVLHDLDKTVSTAGVLHYFCDFAAGKEQTPTFLVQSLVRQMLVRGTESQMEVLKGARDRLRTPLALKDLVDMFIAMCKLQPQGPYIVLDALDELEGRNVLFPLLREFVQGGCHVFVTSRHMPDIADALASCEQVEIEADQRDLFRFIDSELQASDFAEFGFTHGIVEKIVDQAGGIFLLARLLLSHLLALTTIKQIRQSLAALPSNLASAYQSSLDRILAQPPARRALALRLIAWITHAERRLTTAELTHAFAVEDEADEIDEENFTSVRIMLQVCVGLVIFNEDTTVILIHPTAHSFFKDVDNRFMDTHIDMASTCLRYLCLPAPFSAGPCDNVADITIRLSKMSFLAYAAHYWGRHARHFEQPLIPLIRKLLDDPDLRASSFQALQYRTRLQPQLAEAAFAALPTGQGPLHVAAFWDLQTSAELYLDKLTVSLHDTEGWTPLHWACFTGSRIVRDLLLARDAPVDAQDSHGWTPIFWASFNGDVEALTGFLAHGAAHTLKDLNEWTALRWAISARQRHSVEVLLNHNACFLGSQKGRVLASLSLAEVRQHHTAHNLLPTAISCDNEDADILDSPGRKEAWDRGHFDPPMTNLWRTLSKEEKTRGPEYFLEDVAVSQGTHDVQDWRSRLLHVAIRDDKLNVARLLIELDADPNYMVRTQTALHTAAYRKDPAFVNLLLAAGADPTLRDNNNFTALHRAIINGFENTIAALIAGGADVNVLTNLARRSHSQRTPLMLAGDLILGTDTPVALPTRVAQMLLDADAELGTLDNSGRAAIHYAIQACDLALVRLLLERGATISAPDSAGYTVVHTFARSRAEGKCMDDVQTLLDVLLERLPSGAESIECHQCASRVGVKSYEEIHNKHWLPWFPELHDLDSDKDFHSPLSLAIRFKNWKAFTALMKRGARIPKTESLEFLLNIAIVELQPTAVRFLLDSGAEVVQNIEMMKLLESSHGNATAREGLCRILNDLVKSGFRMPPQESILCITAKKHDAPEIVEALLDAGADLYQKDDEGLDAFLLATIHQNVVTLRALLDKCAKKSPPTGHWTCPRDPTHLASATDVIQYICVCLKRHNLISQHTTRTNMSLLQLAVDAGSAHTVALLLACGANADEPYAEGWRPLHVAISKGNGDIVDALLSAEVDVNAVADIERPWGWTGTALHLAVTAGDVRIVVELLTRGADVHAKTATGSTALNIALATESPNYRLDEAFRLGGEVLGRKRLDIAAILVDCGADVTGVLEQLNFEHVLKFEDREYLWDRLRGAPKTQDEDVKSSR